MPIEQALVKNLDPTASVLRLIPTDIKPDDLGAA
jgi:hypothetical protein